MTYQVIASPRTGSSILNQYALHDNDGFGFYEFFLDYIDMDRNWHRRLFYSYSIEEKLEFLEYYKSVDIHFSLKFFPSQVLFKRPDLEQRFIKYFNGYKNLTIERDPWESFLSYSYQSHINWETSHNCKNIEVIDLNEYKINLQLIPEYVKIYKVNRDFTFKIDIDKTFKYKEITIDSLQNFFNTDFDPGSRHMNLDYIAKAINIKEAREMFDYEMHGARNWNNN